MGGADPFAWPAAAVIRAWVPMHATRGAPGGAPQPPTPWGAWPTNGALGLGHLVPHVTPPGHWRGAS